MTTKLRSGVHSRRVDKGNPQDWHWMCSDCDKKSEECKCSNRSEFRIANEKINEV